jgi:hypothetical protein
VRSEKARCCMSDTADELECWSDSASLDRYQRERELRMGRRLAPSRLDRLVAKAKIEIRTSKAAELQGIRERSREHGL